MPRIRSTCDTILQLEREWQVERSQRYARRNKIRYIDDLINEFEMLNLAEEADIPVELSARVVKLVHLEGHPIKQRPSHEVAIAEWMEALYDVQDTLMLSVEDELD